jgi:hypothetical protein
MLSLIVTVVIDISIVKVYDLVDKSFISDETKFLLFSINTSVCIALEFFIIKYLYTSFKGYRWKKSLKINLLYKISFISLLMIGTLMAVLIFQQLYYNYYKIVIPILIVIISYIIASTFIIILSILFLSWYKSQRNKIIFLYFISMLLIAFNLVMTATITVIKLSDRPNEIRNFIGGTVDLSVGKYEFLNNIYKASSILSFISIWITTALLMNYYREKIINVIAYWILLSIPLVYFLINYIYQIIFTNILISYLTIDPITVSIILTTFLSLSKPIGGLTFAAVFWNISKTVGYEKNIKSSMVISGWGILLIFGANQGLVQALAPYPPFGLVTNTVLIIGGFLMLLGIYNSAILVSVNDNLRKSIYKHFAEPRLLGLIGQAEMKKEIEGIVKEITQRKGSLERETNIPIEFDEKALKKYINYVIKETKKEEKDKVGNY